MRGERRRRETQVVRVHFALVGDGNEHVEKIVTSLVVVDDGVVLVCGCSCLGDGSRSIMTTRKTFNSVLVSLASFSKIFFATFFVHTLNSNSFVFDLTIFIGFSPQETFRTRTREGQRENEPNVFSIDQPPRLPPICLARCLYSHFFDFEEEKQTFYINKRENWNKKREKTSKGGKRTRDGKGSF